MVGYVPAIAIRLGCSRQVKESALEVSDNIPKVGKRIVVGEETEAEPPAVAHRCNAERRVFRQWHDGIEGL